MAVAIDNPLAVYVLQHPDETRHARGSAIIAQLCLQHYQCWVGEDFSSHAGLQQLLAQHAQTSLLVYPSPDAWLLADPQQLAGEYQQQALPFMPQRLIFIDASWRKAKKIWHSTPLLQTLSCVKLAPAQTSRYRIRKVPGEGYLSTIEAIACSLMWLERQQEKYLPLLTLFDAMIDRQINKMGRQTYLQNYVSPDANKTDEA